MVSRTTFVVLLFGYLHGAVSGSFCGSGAISFSFESLPNGQPVLGCMRPKCFGWNSDSKPAGSPSAFFTVNDKPDGHFRESPDSVPTKISEQDAQYYKPQVAVCSPTYDSARCIGNNKWLGGIGPLADVSLPLAVQCCEYEPLINSTDRGVAVVNPGQIVIGGEILNNGRLYAFDYISDVFKRVKPDGTVSYEVTIRRMSCIPHPNEFTVNSDQLVTDEIVNAFGETERKTKSGAARAFQDSIKAISEQSSLREIKTSEQSVGLEDQQEAGQSQPTDQTGETAAASNTETAQSPDEKHANVEEVGTVSGVDSQSVASQPSSGYAPAQTYNNGEGGYGSAPTYNSGGGGYGSAPVSNGGGGYASAPTYNSGGGGYASAPTYNSGGYAVAPTYNSGGYASAPTYNSGGYSGDSSSYSSSGGYYGDTSSYSNNGYSTTSSCSTGCGYGTSTDCCTQQFCFSADTTVKVPGGKTKRMDELKVGDWVLSNNQQQVLYVDVKSWIHKMPNVEAEFHRIELTDGKVLKLTSHHYIYKTECSDENNPIPFKKLNQVPVYAEKVRVGDCLYVLSGKEEEEEDFFEQRRVQRIDIVKETGIYAPMTLGGDIIVNDIRASCYNILSHATIQKSFLENLYTLPSIGWMFGEDSTTEDKAVDLPHGINLLVGLMEYVLPQSIYSI